MFTFAVIFVVFVYLLAELGFMVILNENLIPVLCSTLCLWPGIMVLNSTGNLDLSRGALIICTHLCSLIWCIIFGREQGLHHHIFSVILLPIIIFEKHKRKHVVGFAPFPFFVYCFVQFGPDIQPYAVLTPNALFGLQALTITTNFLLTVIFLLVLQNQYEQQLSILRRVGESKAEFLHSMSHELRTPMSSIIGLTDLLLHSKFAKDSKLRYFLKIIHSSGETLLSVVDDILDLAKIEAGKVVLNKSELKLKEYLEVSTKNKQTNKQTKIQTKMQSKTQISLFVKTKIIIFFLFISFSSFPRKL
jgi:hypothetical protein